MSYCQLDESGTYLREVFGDVQEWDANNYCSVDALVRDGKAAQFRIVPLVQTEPPTFDSDTQRCMRDGGEFVSGRWQYKWRIEPMSPVEISARLDTARSAKNAEINAARLAVNFSTFEHAGKQFACDQLSRSDIDGTNGFVSLFGVLPQAPGWPGGWKAVDNTFLPITTVPAWKAFYASLFAAGGANFARAQELKAALAEAETLAEIAAVVW